ncbi:acyl-CoA thioesterase [Fuerstiella marisgermanici]|uniref:Long-chain acyl-CoA thioesterase FadM n=1 Tax=Fuerstiella marisgermanici TaxID=1891926 RepID=A0A1P8WJJ3_9PLAN|nr:thioesterase family protein [Fuerstiella marisgermanici]APZ94223.1 Long-chain acyl-CoA thioesterase FadM [Fuerstiella marisgermanici]
MPVQDNLPPGVSEALREYRTITTIPVQWGDMDAFGHVNNVVYIRWLESARVDLLDSVTSEVTMATGGIGPILASVHCDYKRQLHFPDTVHIGSRTERIGRTSVDVEHAVFSQNQQAVVAFGKSVLVVFDYAANRPVRIPESLRAGFEDK